MWEDSSYQRCRTQSQQAGPAGQGAYHQSWQPKFSSWNPRGKNGEPIPTDCPLTAVHTCAHTHAHDIFFVKDV